MSKTPTSLRSAAAVARLATLAKQLARDAASLPTLSIKWGSKKYEMPPKLGIYRNGGPT
jgi:hypothetical protein